MFLDIHVFFRVVLLKAKLNRHYKEWSYQACHPHKSRKRRLRQAMKRPPKGKAVCDDIARAKF